MSSIDEQIVQLTRQRTRFAVCTIVATKGSTPRECGAKMIVPDNGRICGTIGGGELEKVVAVSALEVINKAAPRLIRYDLLHQLGMCCGGTVDVFIEPYLPKKRLYIFGAGHIGHALAKGAVSLGFETVLIDERGELMDDIEDKEILKMKLPYCEVVSSLPFDHDTFICIMTYSHPIDREILAQCVNKPHAYLGMIGSKRKAEVTKKIFREGQLATEEQLEQIDMPMGIEIGAEGPQEIAISILAKLIAVRRQHELRVGSMTHNNFAV